jgi:hypothetical protein
MEWVAVGALDYRFAFLNVTVHPALVRGATASRLLLISGNRWTVLASSGMLGIGRVAVCVDCIVCWLATWTVIGFVAGFLLGRFVLLEK